MKLSVPHIVPKAHFTHEVRFTCEAYFTFRTSGTLSSKKPDLSVDKCVLFSPRRILNRTSPAVRARSVFARRLNTAVSSASRTKPQTTPRASKACTRLRRVSCPCHEKRCMNIGKNEQKVSNSTYNKQGSKLFAHNIIVYQHCNKFITYDPSFTHMYKIPIIIILIWTR